MIALLEPRKPADLDAAKALFLEYAQSLDFSLCFQGFEAEMAEFPAMYARPRGALVLGLLEGAPAGAVGVRPLSATICEMKRLYVRPETRGAGLGVALASAAIGLARARGYAAMRLDTLPSMQAALALYRGLGFRPIPAYTFNPVLGALFLQLDLAPREEAWRAEATRATASR